MGIQPRGEPQCSDPVAHPGPLWGDLQKKTLVAREQDPDARAAWQAAQHQLDPTQLLFLDETGTSLSLVPLRAWAPRGKPAVGTAPTGHRRHHTLLSTLTPQGMGPALLIAGAADRAVFETFVEQLLLPVLRPGQTVVLDNVNVHHRARVRQLIEGAGCTLSFLPTYSPDFNPIELAFAKLKGQLRRAQARTVAELETATTAALAAITAADARAFYQAAGYPLPDQLLCNPL